MHRYWNKKLRKFIFFDFKYLFGLFFYCFLFLLGTPYYMSPELFKYKPYSYKSDVWAFGCVLYEMCNLRHAFDAENLSGLAVKIMKGSYPPINSTYSKGLRGLIAKML